MNIIYWLLIGVGVLFFLSLVFNAFRILYKNWKNKKG